MLVKTHKTQDGRIIVALCDSELAGKKFKEGNAQLDLDCDFYRGTEMDEQATGDLIRNSWSCNIVGEKSIRLALKEKVIEKEHIKRIESIPYAISFQE